MKVLSFVSSVLISLFFFACSGNFKPKTDIVEVDPIKVEIIDTAIVDDVGIMTDVGEFSPFDDSLRLHFWRQILCFYLEQDFNSGISNDALDREFIEEMGGELMEGEIMYAPDSSFAIFNYEGESCGAYCNPFWESYVYSYRSNSVIPTDIEFSAIDDIYLLDDGRYLIREYSYGRPASVYSVECGLVRLISFQDGSIIEHEVYQGDKTFGYCQETGVDIDDGPYVYYQAESKTIQYYYGQNYLFEWNEDVDTIRKGALKLENGVFVLDHEEISVNDRR
jgi:hypothetical protein